MKTIETLIRARTPTQEIVKLIQTSPHLREEILTSEYRAKSLSDNQAINSFISALYFGQCDIEFREELAHALKRFVIKAANLEIAVSSVTDSYIKIIEETHNLMVVKFDGTDGLKPVQLDDFQFLIDYLKV